MARRRLRAARTRKRCIERVARLRELPPSQWLNGRSPAQVAESGSIPWAFATMPADAWRRRFPWLEARSRGVADDILAGRLELFGRSLELLRPDGGLDWRFDPRAGELAAFQGDPKIPWEVARGALFPRLGSAFWLAGDERHAARAAGLLVDWVAREPVGPGLHFDSALEVGIRLIALCQAFQFFRRARAFEGPVMEALLRQVAQEAAWLEGHLSDERLVAGNHLLGELAGAIVVDLTFPELAAAEAAARGGARRLDYYLPLFAAEVQRQVHADGVSAEQSTTYGRFVADFVLAVLATARAAGVAAPPGLAARGGALAHWLAAATQPDGALPLIGDNDNGRGVDWGEPGPSHDARGPLRALAVLAADAQPLAFDARPDAADAGDETIEAGPDAVTAWWLGERGLLQLRELRRRAPAPRALTLFPEGGHGALRIGDAFAYVRCGPFGHGLPKPSAHSHADFMAPILWLGGAPVLIDPGTFGYTKAGADRRALQSDRAHSTFTVNGLPMAEPRDAFRWRLIPEPGSLEPGPSDGGEIRLTGRWHPAGAAGKRVAQARTLVYNIGQRVIRFEDTWEARGASSVATVDWRWRFSAGTELTALGPLEWRLQLPEGKRVVITLEPPAGAVVRARILVGWVAPRYAARVAAPMLEITCSGAPDSGGRTVTRFALGTSETDRSPTDSSNANESRIEGDRPS